MEKGRGGREKGMEGSGEEDKGEWIKGDKGRERYMGERGVCVILREE